MVDRRDYLNMVMHGVADSDIVVMGRLNPQIFPVYDRRLSWI